MTDTVDQIAAAMASLQAQRAVLGDDVTELALAALRGRLAGMQPSKPVEPEADEQRLKQATVLFVDIVGSTTMGSRLDPEAIHGLMNSVLRRFSEVVLAHHGSVLQYAGDSLLAVFGATVAHEDDPENAVHAGLAILEEARRFAQRAPAAHGIEGFDVRVGAHTGPVLLGAGIEGGNSVRGSAVNIAARMEQTAPPGTLRISQACQFHVRGLFDLIEQPPLEVKGMERPLVTYLVERARPRSRRSARRGIRGVATRLIDRFSEIERLCAAYRSLAEADGVGLQVLTLVADAGLGKTRLLAEFCEWAAQQARGVRTLTARASERRGGQPYGMLRELLTSDSAMLDSDPPEKARAEWRAAMAPVLGSEGDAAVLGHLLGLDFSAHDSVAGIVGEARQIRDLGFHYASQALRKLAATGPPLLLLLDDLHWADEGSMDFIDHLRAAHADVPILIVGLTRPTLYERRPDWGDGGYRIDLPQLDPRYSQELVTELLQRMDEVPDALRESIVSRAEGNPYYMEELINMLIDQGAIAIDETWRVLAEGLRAADMPSTLTGVLQARVDALAPEWRRTLLQAAVVGHVFWDDALAALGADSEAALQALAARQLIVAHEASSLAGKREYAFKHHSLHSVCYESVLKRHKRAAHASVAQWLAAQPGVAHLDLIAEHFERGGEVPQAVAYWERAAQEAASRYANAAALAHAERGLALMPPAEARRRYALTLLCAKVLRIQSERARLAPRLDELAALADRLDDDALRSEAAECRARFHDDGGDAILGLEWAREALAFAPADAPERAARAQLVIADALSMLGRADEALLHAQAGLAEARLAGNPAVEAMVLNRMGMLANDLGDAGAAIGLFEQALARHRQTKDRSNEAGTLANMGYAAFVLGDYASADAQFGEAAALCHHVGQRQSEGIVQINLALVRLCQGEPAAARSYASSALALLRLAEDRWGEAAALRVAGHAAMALGEPAAAVDAFSASRDLFDSLGLGHLAVEAIAGLAMQALAAGDAAAAMGHVESMLSRQAEGAGLAGTDEPLRIGLICHQVLAAVGDPRAGGVLEATHAELQSRAGKISDPQRRRGFLGNVPWHRELVARWSRVSRS